MDNQLPRVPMPSRSRWMSDDDVNVSAKSDGHRIGRRISMDVDEAALAQIGARAAEYALERLGQEIVYRHRPEIEAAVHAILMDRATIQPIIEQELRRAVREFVLCLWSDDEKKNLRDWFDLFTQKCRGE